MSTGGRGGMLLLEVMLGTAILGIAGVALITVLAQTVETVRHGRTVERQTMSSSQLLDRVTIWSTAELDACVGRQRIGSWNLQVDALQHGVYTISVLDTLTGAALLRTAVYRTVVVSNAP